MFEGHLGPSAPGSGEFLLLLEGEDLNAFLIRSRSGIASCELIAKADGGCNDVLEMEPSVSWNI